MLCRDPTIPFSTDALRSSLLRLENEWEIVPASHSRNAVYGYLTAVFELVTWWEQEGRAVNRAHRALHLRGYSSVREPERSQAIILCTSDPDKVDDRTRSRWSRCERLQFGNVFAQVVNVILGVRDAGRTRGRARLRRGNAGLGATAGPRPIRIMHSANPGSFLS